MSQASIPEVQEDGIGMALEERKAKFFQFQDLGPPDLISIVKYSPSSSNSNSQSSKSRSMQLEPSSSNINTHDLHSKDKLKGEIGTFLYCVGVDTSDPTSIAVSLKNLADLISEKPQNWFGKQKHYKVARITYATWNAFRKCDVEVVVHIPGAVQSYILDARGEILQVPQQDREVLWAETFVCGVVRAITVMSDNADEGEVNNVVETRILNPLTSGELGDVSDRFIDVFPIVYAQGSKLGAPCDVASPSRTNNYLCETLLHVTKLTKNFDRCREMLVALMEKHPECIVLLAKVLLDADLKIDAIALLHKELREQGTSVKEYRSELLCIQAKFLLEEKKDFSAAQKLSQAAADCAPSEFRPWHLLVRSYIGLNDIENALLALNGCPVTPHRESYGFKRVVSLGQDSSNLHLPLPIDVILEDVTSLSSTDVTSEHKALNSSLLNLPAATLKANSRTRYKYLTEIALKTGWEALLKYRSKLFVMEEEYLVSATPPAESDSGSQDTIRSKRLCERWLDSLFMVLYEDLKTYTLWQAEQLHFEAQNTRYQKSTAEWELLGLCALRLGHIDEAARAFQIGLEQRFSAESCRRLLQISLLEHSKVKTDRDASSSQTMAAVLEVDNKLIDLCVKLCCWNHRWYCEFSVLQLETLGHVVHDIGIIKLSNEIRARFPESVMQLVQDNLLDFFANYTHDGYDK
ncbi:LANO_0B05864g1_1 [Lachancea nothofagi CBS 11611]|uniref:LANO_0B05864g1_1 n=1 Tax=Lachancea nothofagi CBS 11611 TaxID=1266666 RepID=A0A1G4IYQ2_9SACH|nr:LANO_0B05864g1_1 [Lachancea nothofagi CBS 11611]